MILNMIIAKNKMGTLVCDNIPFNMLNFAETKSLVKIQIVSDNTQNNDKFMTNIMKIKDFNSEEFYQQLTSLLKGKLIRHNSDERIWSLQGSTWKLCKYNNAKKFMKEIFEAYLNTFIYNDSISIDEKKVIENTINRWKYANPEETNILNKILVNLSVEAKYLIENNIISSRDFVEEKTLETSNVEPKISSSAYHLANLESFLAKHIEFTDNKDDFIVSTDLHNLYKPWCEKNSLVCCDVRFFGRLLKLKNIQQKKSAYGAKNICIKYHD